MRAIQILVPAKGNRADKKGSMVGAFRRIPSRIPCSRHLDTGLAARAQDEMVDGHRL